MVAGKKARIVTAAVLERDVGCEPDDRLYNYVAFGKILVPLEDTIVVGNLYQMRSCNPADFTYQVDVDDDHVFYTPSVDLKYS